MAAWIVLVCTFPLIWMGGLVTSHGAGMAVPDWPNSFGYNMFALPFTAWLGSEAGGVFYEHFHRILGMVAGMAVVLVVAQAFAPARNVAFRRKLGAMAIAWLLLGTGAAIITWSLEAAGRIDPNKARLSGHFVSGFISLGVLFIVLWSSRRRETRTWLRRVCLILLGAIVLQGLMGGLRVTEVSLTLAKLHGIFGQLVFALAAAVCVFSSRWWVERPIVDAITAKNSKKMGRLAIVAIFLIVCQLVLGALMRHDPLRSTATGGGAGLAIPDWPLHYGKLIPPMSKSALPELNRIRAEQYNLPEMPSIAGVHLQFTHRLIAYLTAGHILAMVGSAWFRVRNQKGLLIPTLALAVLVVVQVSLGVATVLMRKPADIATAHQATGSLLLAVAVVLCVRSFREYAARDRRVGVVEPSTTSPAGLGSLAPSH
ncbi:MAG: COX15/CtaA family protein [Tepidisphaeraceae bacterium]